MRDRVAEAAWRRQSCGQLLEQMQILNFLYRQQGRAAERPSDDVSQFRPLAAHLSRRERRRVAAIRRTFKVVVQIEGGGAELAGRKRRAERRLRQRRSLDCQLIMSLLHQLEFVEVIDKRTTQAGHSIAHLQLWKACTIAVADVQDVQELPRRLDPHYVHDRSSRRQDGEAANVQRRAGDPRRREGYPHALQRFQIVRSLIAQAIALQLHRRRK